MTRLPAGLDVRVVDRDRAIYEALIPLLTPMPVRLAWFRSAAECRRQPVRPQSLALVLRATDQSVLDLLSEMRRRAPEAPIVLLVAPSDVDTAVEGMRRGASDVLESPVVGQLVVESIRSALERVAGRRDAKLGA